MFWLGILAGAYLGLGATFYIYVSGQLTSIGKTDPGIQHLVLGAFGLPMALGLIIITGSELFTANCCYLSAAVFEVSKYAYALDFLTDISVHTHHRLRLSPICRV